MSNLRTEDVERSGTLWGECKFGTLDRKSPLLNLVESDVQFC